MRAESRTVTKNAYLDEMRCFPHGNVKLPDFVGRFGQLPLPLFFRFFGGGRGDDVLVGDDGHLQTVWKKVPEK